MKKTKEEEGIHFGIMSERLRGTQRQSISDAFCLQPLPQPLLQAPSALTQLLKPQLFYL